MSTTESEEKEGTEAERRQRGKEAAAAAAERRRVVIPDVASMPLFDFLERLFFRGSEAKLDVDMGGWPQKVTLHVARGATGERLGACIREVPFVPKIRMPEKDEFVELSNTLLAAAQADCDALNKTTRYVLLAHDLRRSDRPYARFLLRLSPSGMPTALEAERGVGAGDDDEESTMSTKLLLGLLESERRDKRWTFEQSMNLISGVVENQNERLERMESLVDQSFRQRVEYLTATEALLNQAADRDAKKAWDSWKRDKINIGVDKALAALEMVAPQIAAKALGTNITPGRNEVTTFLEAISDEQAVRAFGDYLPGSDHDVQGGIFSNEQFQQIMRLRNTSANDPVAQQLVASLTPEQIAQARELFGDALLLPLVSWLRSGSSTATAQP